MASRSYTRYYYEDDGYVCTDIVHIEFVEPEIEMAEEAKRKIECILSEHESSCTCYAL